MRSLRGNAASPALLLAAAAVLFACAQAYTDPQEGAAAVAMRRDVQWPGHL